MKSNQVWDRSCSQRLEWFNYAYAYTHELDHTKFLSIYQNYKMREKKFD